MEDITVALLFACPACPPVVEARRLVFSEWFWENAVVAALPFLVTLLAARWFVGRLDREAGDEPRD